MSEGRLAASDVSSFVGCSVDFRRCCTGALRRTLKLCPGFADGGLRPPPRRCWHRATRLIPTRWRPRTARDWSVDAGAFVIAAALGALILSVTVDDAANRMTSGRVAIDAAFGALCCISLWWRRRWPFGVALVCVLLGAFSRLARSPACSHCPRWLSTAMSGPPCSSPRCSFRPQWCARSGSGGPIPGR